MGKRAFELFWTRQFLNLVSAEPRVRQYGRSCGLLRRLDTRPVRVPPFVEVTGMTANDRAKRSVQIQFRSLQRSGSPNSL